MLHFHKAPSQQNSVCSLRGFFSIIGGVLIAGLLVTISLDLHRVVRLPEANLDVLVQKHLSPQAEQVLASRTPTRPVSETIVSAQTDKSIHHSVLTDPPPPLHDQTLAQPQTADNASPLPNLPTTSPDHVESQLTPPSTTTVTLTPTDAAPSSSEVPTSRPAPVKPRFPIHVGPARTTVQPVAEPPTVPPPPSPSTDQLPPVPVTETHVPQSNPVETSSTEVTSPPAVADIPATSPSSPESPTVVSNPATASSDVSPVAPSATNAPTPGEIPPSSPPMTPVKARDPSAWTPSVVPAHCLCTNMFTRTANPPLGLYQLKLAPDSVMKNDSFTLPSYYSPENTGDAAMNDPRWRQYMYYEECGMMLPRDVLINKVPPTVGKDFDLQLPTCLLQDIWLNVPDLSNLYTSSPPAATGTSIGRGAAALALAMANPSLNQLTVDTPRALTPPLMSIELVVFNQADYISQVLLPILHLTRQPFELVILFDTADDESIQVVQGILHAVYQHCDMDHEFSSATDWELFPMKPYTPKEGYRFGSSSRSGSNWSCLNPYLVHVRTLFQPTPLFETASNNVQFRASHPASKYYISVQDDQPMETLGWNELLTRPLEWYDDVIGVSARCAHGFYTERHVNVDAGRCRDDVFQPLDHSKWSPRDRCSFYVRDTANRGPLALHAERLKAMGYLDEQHIRLDGDDHDLFARSYAAEKWKAGFFPLEWASDPNKGGMRKYKRPPTEKELQWKDYRARYALATPKGLEVVRKRALMEGWPNHNEHRMPPPNALKHCLVKPEGKQDFDANGNVVFFTKQWWQEPEDTDNIPE